MFRWLPPFQTPTQQPDFSEEELRRQVRELERDAIAFHESIGLLRAALALSGDSEQFWREQLYLSDLPAPAEPQNHHSFAVEGWRRERLHSHVLRNLYQQILEIKRRFLYRWHENLQQRLQQLPAERQSPLQALLDNTLQAILSMSVEQIEATHRQKLESLLIDTPALSSPATSPLPKQDAASPRLSAFSAVSKKPSTGE